MSFPSGNPEIMTLSVSEPSVSVSAAASVNGMPTSSAPLPGWTAKIGRSGIGLMPTVIGVCDPPPSTRNVAVPLKFALGVKMRSPLLAEARVPTTVPSGPTTSKTPSPFTSVATGLIAVPAGSPSDAGETMRATSSCVAKACGAAVPPSRATGAGGGGAAGSSTLISATSIIGPAAVVVVVVNWPVKMAGVSSSLCRLDKLERTSLARGVRIACRRWR